MHVQLMIVTKSGDVWSFASILQVSENGPLSIYKQECYLFLELFGFVCLTGVKPVITYTVVAETYDSTPLTSTLLVSTPLISKTLVSIPLVSTLTIEQTVSYFSPPTVLVF